MTQKWIKGVVKRLDDEHSLRTTSAGTIYLNEQRVSPSKAAQLILDTLEGDINSETELMLSRCLNGKDSKSVAELLAEIRKATRKESTTKTAEGSYVYGNTMRLVDIESGEDKVYDIDKKVVTKLDVFTWMKFTGKKAEEEAAQACRIVYEPHEPSSTWSGEYLGATCAFYNAYVPPAWRQSQVEPCLPTLYEEFFNLFFTTEASREMAFKWLANSIMGRNQFFMCLIGIMGSGKGTFALLAEHLVGSDNYILQNHSIKKSRFTGEFRNKQLGFLDEFTIDDAGKTITKVLANDFVTYEKKNINVEGQEKNHTSFIIANNVIEDNKIVREDRRFFLPDITKVKLLKLWDVEKVEEFRKSISENDEDFQAFALWLLANHTPDPLEMQDAPKTDWFYDVCVLCLHNWQRFIYDQIKTCKDELYDILDLKMDYEEETGSTRFPDSSKINHFLDNFRDREGNRLGAVIKIKRRAYIKADKSQIEVQNETSEEEDYDI